MCFGNFVKEKVGVPQVKHHEQRVARFDWVLAVGVLILDLLESLVASKVKHLPIVVVNFVTDKFVFAPKFLFRQSKVKNFWNLEVLQY